MDPDKLEKLHRWQKDKTSTKFKRCQLKMKISAENRHRTRLDKKNKQPLKDYDKSLYGLADIKE